MIHAVKPAKPYKSKIGDLCWGDKKIGKHLQALTSATIRGRKQLRLDMYEENPWEGLALLGVDAGPLKLRYDCPVTGLRFWAVVPYCLWITDVAAYRVGRLLESHYDYMFDTEFADQMFPYTPGEIPHIHDKMLGTGYDSGCRPCDGHGKVIEALAPLENGDFLHLYVWEWYNK